jgi:hypothetical protein
LTQGFSDKKSLNLLQFELKGTKCKSPHWEGALLLQSEDLAHQPVEAA